MKELKESRILVFEVDESEGTRWDDNSTIGVI